MQKTILITGATDGIGLETAKTLAAGGHRVLIHGRSQEKLTKAETAVAAQPNGTLLGGYLADLSRMNEVETFANTVTDQHDAIDVLINNAGVFRVPEPTTGDGLDVRFAVNTIAPYLLTQRLLPLIGPGGRVVNVSSAAQSPVDLTALTAVRNLSDMDAMDAYAQSKLAITMWSSGLAQSLAGDGPAIIAVNPGSMLGSKMVKDAFGVAGGDIQVGADILTRAAIAEEFANASGKYFDNDKGEFSSPHQDALNQEKNSEIIQVIESVLSNLNIKPSVSGNPT